MKTARPIVLALFFLAAAACATPTRDQNAPSVTSSSLSPRLAAAGLARVDDPRMVCMVNDQYMGKEQIPVVVGAKTYFGCCAMCKEKLRRNSAVRTAIDPFSGRVVDKAVAIIVRNDEGKVLYFESEDTLKSYLQ